jgi:fructose-specific phosphotransferase system IIA component
MLLVIMHDDKRYLDKVLSIIYTEGISNVTIFEGEGLVKSLHGMREGLVSTKLPEMVKEFDYALIAVVPEEEKIEQLNECIQQSLRFHPSVEKGLLFTLPNDNVEKLFRKSRGGEEMMNLIDLINEERVCLELSAADKEGTIKEMIEILGNHGLVTDKEELLDGLKAREELESTGIGDGIALPHARTDIVKEIMVAFGRSKKGVDFDALDEKPVYLVFLIVAPKKSSSQLMRLLAVICRILRKKDFRQALFTAESKQEIVRLIEERSRD